MSFGGEQEEFCSLSSSSSFSSSSSKSIFSITSTRRRTRTISQKTISPCPAFRSSRDKWGMGVRQALFPMPTLGAHPCGGCQLPDAILHGKRSLRPRSRAVQCLAAAGFRVRLFSLLGPMVAPPACKPGQDTPAIVFRVLTISTGSAAAFDSAFAPCHGSRLFTLRLHFTHSPAVSFLTSPTLGRFSRSLPSRRVLPGANAHFVPPFSGFLLADPDFLRDRQSRPSVLMRSSNRLPSG